MCNVTFLYIYIYSIIIIIRKMANYILADNHENATFD
jgi:hypothetical protein